MERAAGLIVVFGISVIAAIGYYFYSTQEYFAAVDERVEIELAEADFAVVRQQLRASLSPPVVSLQAIYAGPMNEEMNRRYARLVAGWLQAYPRLKRIPMIPDRLDEMQRLAVEVDERLGPGTFAVMQQQYASYEADAPRRAALRRDLEDQARAQVE
ncbi:MAG TPA: hypothetical protein VEF55_04535, partial [Candidatus Binatia bacterium]|nr:hypothetical protein [Candidatus Binatia bacterium]